jgi:hypothetical protein
MRLVMYAVFRKDTNEKVYTNVSHRKCEEYIAENSGDFEIRYKWISI